MSTTESPTGPPAGPPIHTTAEPRAEEATTPSEVDASTPAGAAAWAEPIVLDGSPTDAAWRWIGASATGRSHIADDRGCDDALGALAVHDVAVGVVADGAGSAALAGAGSRAATRAALAGGLALVLDPERTGKPSRDDIIELVAGVRDEVVREAERLDAAPRMLATTMTLAVVHPGWVAVAQVGDGVAVIQRPGGDVRAVASATRGEYLNETTFLTDERWIDELAHEVVPAADVTGLVLTTDGLEMVALENRRQVVPFAPFFAALLGRARTGLTSGAVQRYLVGVDDRTGDDKTLLVLVPSDRSGSDAGHPSPGGAA